MIFALITAVLYGLSNIYIRCSQERQLGVYTVLLLTLLATALTSSAVLVAHLLTGGVTGFNWPGFWLYLGGGFCTSFLGRYLLFTGISAIGPSRAGSLKVAAPLFTVLLGVMALGEVIRPAGWAGVALVLAGVLVLTRETKAKGAALTVGRQAAEQAGRPAAADRAALAGIICSLLAGLALGVGNVLRKLAVGIFPDLIAGICIGSVFAALCGLVLQLAAGQGRDLLRLDWRRAGPCAWGGGLLTAGVYAFFLALKTAPVSLATTVSSAEPLFTMLASRLTSGRRELISPQAAAGAALVIAGVYVLLAL